MWGNGEYATVQMNLRHFIFRLSKQKKRKCGHLVLCLFYDDLITGIRRLDASQFTADPHCYLLCAVQGVSWVVH